MEDFSRFIPDSPECTLPQVAFTGHPSSPSSSLAIGSLNSSLFAIHAHPSPSAHPSDSSLSISFSPIPLNLPATPLTLDPIPMIQQQAPFVASISDSMPFQSPLPHSPVVWVTVSPAPPTASPAVAAPCSSSPIISSIVPALGAAARFTHPPPPQPPPPLPAASLTATQQPTLGALHPSSTPSMPGTSSTRRDISATGRPSFRRHRLKRPRRPRACDGEVRFCVVCGGRASGYQS